LIGIDIGGTKCAVVLGKVCRNTESGMNIDIMDKIRFPTEVHMGPGHTLEMIFSSIDKVISDNQVDTGLIEGMGVSCGGPLDSRKGVILSPPNLLGWDSIPIVDLLQKRFGIRTCLQNDANACALAEWKFGVAKGLRNVIFLTFGTGMGAGLILDGRLYSGTNDLAGEVGHIRLNDLGPVGFGKSGSFEGFCSGGGITQLARSMVLEKLQVGEKVSFCKDIRELDSLSAKIVGDAAEAGDELAKEIYAASGRYLGRGLSILIDVLNPEMIIIGSIFARSRSLLWPYAHEVICRESLAISAKACRVVPAGLGEAIGDYAAFAVALNSDGGKTI
jgi:glucokinase